MFKFRAWDKVTKRYRKILGIEFYPDGTIKKVRVAGLQRKNSIIPNQLIIEQQTGIKDVNGRDVYEGDIVQTNGDWLQAVKFGEQTHEEDYGDQFVFQGFNLELGCGYPDAIRWDLKVIGNIHENPELLKC